MEYRPIKEIIPRLDIVWELMLYAITSGIDRDEQQWFIERAFAELYGFSVLAAVKAKLGDLCPISQPPDNLPKCLQDQKEKAPGSG